MKKTVSMYVLFFFANSLVYASVVTVKKSLFHDNTLSEKFYIGFIVVGVLSVVSIFSYQIDIVLMSCRKKISKTRFAVILILIVVVSMAVDTCLLFMMTSFIDELHTNLLDRLMLAGFSQILPIRLMDPEED